MIGTIYANLARSKSLWAHRRLGDPLSDRLAAEGLLAAGLLAETASASPADVLTKLAELQDILAEDATPAQAALLASIIRDVHALFDRPDEPPASAAPTPRGTPPSGLPGMPAEPKRPTVRIDRRARPVTVDGVLYPSITAAAVATGTSYELLRQRAG